MTPLKAEQLAMISRKFDQLYGMYKGSKKSRLNPLNQSMNSYKVHIDEAMSTNSSNLSKVNKNLLKRYCKRDSKEALSQFQSKKKLSGCSPLNKSSNVVKPRNFYNQSEGRSDIRRSSFSQANSLPNLEARENQTVTSIATVKHMRLGNVHSSPVDSFMGSKILRKITRMH